MKSINWSIWNKTARFCVCFDAIYIGLKRSPTVGYRVGTFLWCRSSERKARPEWCESGTEASGSPPGGIEGASIKEPYSFRWGYLRGRVFRCLERFTKDTRIKGLGCQTCESSRLVQKELDQAQITTLVCRDIRHSQVWRRSSVKRWLYNFFALHKSMLLFSSYLLYYDLQFNLRNIRG